MKYLTDEQLSKKIDYYHSRRNTNLTEQELSDWTHALNELTRRCKEFDKKHRGQINEQ